jgi:uncharacterized C2H2 Zn-finger protein
MDVGAGTTDVSMFIHGRNRGEDGAPFYSNYLGDGTTAVGGDDIDDELARVWHVDRATARSRKEAGETVPPRMRTLDRIHHHYRAVCGRVLETAMLVAPSDLRYELFLFGGGSRLHALQQAVRRPLSHSLVLAKLQKMTPPRDLKRFPGLVENYDLLAVACGLSSTILDWDRITPRTQVRPMREVTQTAPAKLRTSRPCGCGGMNQDCTFCGGTGYLSGGAFAFPSRNSSASGRAGRNSGPQTTTPPAARSRKDWVCCPSCGHLCERDHFARHLRKAHPHLSIAPESVKSVDLSSGSEFVECSGCTAVMRRHELPKHMKKFHPTFRSRS